MNKNILIIAGEPSGDMRGGELLARLMPLVPGTRFWGIGGDRMAAKGMELVEHVRDLSMVGLLEIIKKLPRVRRQFRALKREIGKREPFLAILIDYPGFNLKVARYLHSKGIPVVYFIIPQVWAWGRWRIRAIKEHVSKALVLFDFEEKLLREHGVDCEFVGHPLVDEAPSPARRQGTTAVALLPGSREHEINTLYPVMLEAAEIINAALGDVRFFVAESSNVKKEIYDSILAGHEGLDIKRLTDDTFCCLNECDLAVVTSGTATLETAVMEKPMVITYKASPVTAFLARKVAGVRIFGLANILAGEVIVPELLQEDATPEKLSGKALEILSDAPGMERMRSKLREVKRRLGSEGAAERAARAILRFIEEKKLL